VKRIRRRALRGAWLLRRHYEGRPVPDLPVSLGENARVFPEPYSSIPEQQILEPHRRKQALFVDDALELSEKAQYVLEQSVLDLKCNAELRELGMATFLDRPLSVLKHPSEADRTPLLTYEAFSKQRALERLRKLQQWGAISHQQLEDYSARLDELPVKGFPVAELGAFSTNRVVALEDALQSAMDFVFLRTIRRSLSEFLAHYDFEPLREYFPEEYRWLFTASGILLIRTVPEEKMGPGEPILTAFDEHMQKRLEFGLGRQSIASRMYLHHAGVEYFRTGLQLLSVRKTESDKYLDIREQQLVMPPVIGSD